MSARRKGPTPKTKVAPSSTSRRPPRSPARLALLTLAGTVAVAVLALSIVGIRLWTGVTRVSIAAPGAGGGATNYLLVGSDARPPGEVSGAPPEGAGERADLVMVLHVPANGTPSLLSIPRDTLVALPGLPGTHRLTLALTKGPQNLVDTLCGALGIGVDHVVIVNFEGFRSLIDLVGGIDLDFPTAARDVASGLDVGAGRQHLDGAQALALVRSRHTEVLEGDAWTAVTDGADRRVHRAGDVLGALAAPAADQAASLPGKVKVAAALRGDVTVDDGTGRDDVDRIMAALRAVEAGPPDARRDVPVVHVDGEIPTASLAAGARDALVSVGAGASPACPTVP